MPFDLPRSPKGLRFTGSVRALALGRERPPRAPDSTRAPSSPSHRHQQPPQQEQRRTPRDIYAADVVPTPYVGPSHPAARAATHSPARPAPLAPARARMPSFDDDAQTMALDRDALALGLAQPSAPAEPPRHGLPVPNFRPATAGAGDSPGPQMIFAPPSPSSKPSGAPGLSLAVWVVAAVIAGMFSYRAAPEALDGIEHAAHTLAE